MSYLRLRECLQLLTAALAGLLRDGARLGALARPDAPLYGAALLSHLLFAYTYNDYTDHELDRADPNKPEKAALDRRVLRGLALVFFGLAVASAAVLPARLAALLLALQALWVLYSHPATRLKGRVPLPALFHLAGGAGFYLSGPLLLGAGTGPRDWLGAACFGLLNMSGGLHNEVSDRARDEASGIRTLAVALGAEPAFALVALAQIVALGCLAAYAASPAGLLACGAALLFYAAAWRRARRGLGSPGVLRAFRARYRLVLGSAVGAVLLEAALSAL